DVASGKMAKAARMLRMQMGQNHCPDILGLDAQLGELRTDFLMRLDLHLRRALVIQMPLGRVTLPARVRRLDGYREAEDVGRVDAGRSANVGSLRVTSFVRWRDSDIAR